MHLSLWHIMCMQIPPPWLGCVDTMTNITAMGAVGAMGIDSQWWGYEKTITNTTTELCDYHNQHHRLCKHHKQHPTSFHCYQQHCRYVNIMSNTAELYEDRLHPLQRITYNMLTTAEVDEHYHLDPCRVTWIPQPPTLQSYMNMTTTNITDSGEYHHQH